MRHKYSSILEALSGRTSQYFWASISKEGEENCGNPVSYFAKEFKSQHLTFDISNNRVLANVNINGSIKDLTLYYQSYPIDSEMPGVWFSKHLTIIGPLSYKIRVDDEKIDLSNYAQIEYCKTSLLENIIPLTEVFTNKFKAKLITYTPISEDGQIRPACVIYGLLLENKMNKILEGDIILPETSMNSFVDLIDDKGVGKRDLTLPYRGEIPFKLKPKECEWFPTVIFPDFRPEMYEEISISNSLDWLNSTISYFKHVTGELEMPQDTFTQEYFERQVHQCFHSIPIVDDGSVAGSNWGSYPATRDTWMKDMYYSFLPFTMLEPKLVEKGILWFLNRSVRPDGLYYRGGVSHSLTNALTPVILAGLYYKFTGNKEFFLEHPEVINRLTEIIMDMLNTSDGKVALFKSYWLSDGPSRGDYHTGSNVLAWLALNLTAEIYEKVYGNRWIARWLRSIANKTKEDLNRLCVIEGPFGKQYIEGVNSNGSLPCMCHDGEETDTTLMPFYGFTTFDDPVYKNYMKFSLSEHNEHYSSIVKGIKWIPIFKEEEILQTDIKRPAKFIQGQLGMLNSGATCPGYITGFASISNAEEMREWMLRLRKRTDMDGSMWWWMYPPNPKGEHDVVRAPPLFGAGERSGCRNFVGKSGWAAGTFVALFISEILGLKYDGSDKKLYFRPFSPLSDFSWENFRLGGGLFSVKFLRNDDEIYIYVFNQNPFRVKTIIEVPIEGRFERAEINGAEIKPARRGRFFEKETVIFEMNIDKEDKIEVKIKLKK